MEVHIKTFRNNGLRDAVNKSRMTSMPVGLVRSLQMMSFTFWCIKLV